MSGEEAKVKDDRNEKAGRSQTGYTESSGLRS